MSKVLRDKINAAVDFSLSPISIPEWGSDGEFFIRPMRLKEQREVLKHIKSREDDLFVAALSITYSLCDSTGALVLGPEDVDMIMEKSASVCSRIMHQVNSANGISDENVEDAVKN